MTKWWLQRQEVRPRVWWLMVLVLAVLIITSSRQTRRADVLRRDLVATGEKVKRRIARMRWLSAKLDAQAREATARYADTVHPSAPPRVADNLTLGPLPPPEIARWGNDVKVDHVYGMKVDVPTGCVYGGRRRAKRSCTFRSLGNDRSTYPPMIYDGPELSIEWSRYYKAWVVRPHGGKVLWGPNLLRQLAEADAALDVRVTGDSLAAGTAHVMSLTECADRRGRCDDYQTWDSPRPCRDR